MLIAGVDKYVVHMIPKGPCHIFIYQCTSTRNEIARISQDISIVTDTTASFWGGAARHVGECGDPPEATRRKTGPLRIWISSSVFCCPYFLVSTMFKPCLNHVFGHEHRSP